ncbi:MAG: hypothetical protein IJ282_05490 [Lachnospiraceae bacterium]|nr:hypothetical protein [Lachnospiraceae bacterium]
MFKKSKIFILATLAFLCISISLPVSAMEMGSYNTVYATDINVVDLDIPDYNESKTEDTNDINNTPTTYSIDEAKEVLNVLPQLRSRSAYLFEDNPNASASGTLTESNDMDLYFFSVTDTSKFLLAQLTSGNADYVAQLYVVDSETGDATATNIYGFAGDLIQLNGLPVGEYAFVIFSNSATYGQDYVLDINATNPAANITSVYYLASDLSIFMYETETGDVYGNGSLIYNTSTNTGSNLTWQRVDEFSWGSGYEQRTHSVFNVKIKAMSSPVSYSSAKASSDCAVLLYCDEGTAFSYLHTYYQSGVDPVYESTTVDTTDRTTPRELDELDFVEGNEHILVYDMNTGSVIDFYSTLNIYYAGGYEAQPTIAFY